MFRSAVFVCKFMNLGRPLIQTFLQPGGRPLRRSNLLHAHSHNISISLKMYFGSKYRILPFRRKPRDTTPSLFSMLRSEEESPFPYPLRYSESQSLIITEEVFGDWERVNFSVIFKMLLALRTLQRLHIRLELPLHKVTMECLVDFCCRRFKCRSIVSNWQI